MFISKCGLRRQSLPLLPCECGQCEWYIDDANFNNCFWLLAEFMHYNPGVNLTFEQISKVVNLPLQEVIRIFEIALIKMRKESVKLAKEDIN
jgi:hypothetical protein